MQWVFNALGGRKNTNVLIIILMVVLGVVGKQFLGLDIPWEYMPYILGVPAAVALYFIKKEGEADLEKVKQWATMYRDEAKIGQEVYNLIDDLFDDDKQKEEVVKRVKKAVRKTDKEREKKGVDGN